MTPSSTTNITASEKARARYEALKAIHDEDPEGMLRPEVVVSRAHDPDSPLHDAFEWDNDAAAHQYRLEQARRMIRSFTVTTKTSQGEETEARAFYHVVVSDADGEAAQGYVSAERIANDETLREQVRLSFIARMRHFARQAALVTEFAEVFKAFDAIVGNDAD